MTLLKTTSFKIACLLRMNDLLKIYIDRLRDGHTEEIDAHVPPDFIDEVGDDCVFRDNVDISGQAYLAEDKLVFHIDLFTRCLCRCIICNEQVPFDIRIEHVYHLEEISAVKGAVFDMKPMLREMILLEIPPYLECHGGNCPARGQINSFLKKEISTHENLTKQDEGYHPFSHLTYEDSHVLNRDLE